MVVAFTRIGESSLHPEGLDPFMVSELDRAHKILSTSIGVDSHVDTLQRLLIEGLDFSNELPNGHVDYPRLKLGHVSILFCALWTPTYFPQQAALARTFELLNAIQGLCSQTDRFRIVVNISEAREIIRKGSIALVLSLEGCQPLGGDLGLLRQLRKAGISSVTLTHIAANELADSSTAAPIHGGLSALGRAAILEMNQLGLLIDVSHCSDAAVEQVLGASERPVIASHSCCRKLCETPRNLPDSLIKAIVARGGVVCIAAHAAFLHPADRTELNLPIGPHSFQHKTREDLDKYLAKEHLTALAAHITPNAGLSDVVAHIDHAIRVAGSRGVGLGSDFDGGITPPRGFTDVSKRPYLAAELLQRGYDSADVARVFGENVVSVLESVQEGSVTNR